MTKHATLRGIMDLHMVLLILTILPKMETAGWEPKGDYLYRQHQIVDNFGEGHQLKDGNYYRIVGNNVQVINPEIEIDPSICSVM